jgi:enamine deaminase RidA (YjgF/YER057c/UK114 family)
MTIRLVQIPGQAPPSGHYSHAVVHGGLVYVSGVLGNARDYPPGQAPDLAAQARHCLSRTGEILAAAGSDLGHVLKLTVYVTDLAFRTEVDRLCAETFGPHRPSRTVVPCPALRFGSLIETDAIAALIDGLGA